MSPFDCEHKVENTPLFALMLVRNSSNLLETGPREVGTAEHRVCHSQQKVFDKRLRFKGNGSGGAVATLYLFIILKIAMEHDVHWNMLAVYSLKESDICKCWVCLTPMCNLQIVVDNITFHTYHE